MEEKLKQQAHEFLMRKGVNSLSEHHCALEIEYWLAEFAQECFEKR